MIFRRGARSGFGPLVLAGACGALAACSVDGRTVSVVGSSSSPNGSGGALDENVAANRPVGAAPPASAADAGVAIPCTVGAFSPQCPEVICPPDDACRNFAPRVPAGTCVAPGRCATAGSCIALWTDAARGGTACICTAERCAFALGVACSDASDCESDACVSNGGQGLVCCAQSCAIGESCTTDRLGCEPRPICLDGERQCSGAILQYCTERQWVDTYDCGSEGCNPPGRCNGEARPLPSTPLPSTPPPTTPPPSTPAAPPAQGLCSDACSVLFEQANGACSDTGENFAACDPGTDCTDCGMRPSGCTDTCTTLQFAGDGDCDDGREGSFSNLCAPGTDCTDCGVLLP